MFVFGLGKRGAFAPGGHSLVIYIYSALGTLQEVMHCAVDAFKRVHGNMVAHLDSIVDAANATGMNEKTSPAIPSSQAGPS